MAETKKVAVCLFVRDEADDIASWLAWYHLLGLEPRESYSMITRRTAHGRFCARRHGCSTSGSLRASGDPTSFHAHRQAACSLDAIERYGSEFEWIGFFNADEYLRLRDSRTIQDFLKKFPAPGTHGNQLVLLWQQRTCDSAN